MKTIVGLGNPGKEYEGTRHNIGREIALKVSRCFDFSNFEESDKYYGLLSKGLIGSEKYNIMLPNTFMNKSGKAVSALKQKAKNLIIMHDDGDIALGTVKVSFGKNSGGHKGVESVFRALRSKDIWRIRIGIQKKKRVPAEDLVLQKFNDSEKRILKKVERIIFKLLESELSVTTISEL